jgi:nucleoside 2-deoxyribosyltransferase
MEFMLHSNQRIRLRLRRRPRHNQPVRGARVYLAARFARQPELRDIAEELHCAGAEVTSRWLGSERSLEQFELTGDGRSAELARMDIDDLKAAEICIAFTENGDGPSGRGGRHTELGIALALNLRVVLIGPREHVFHCLPTVERYASWQEARQPG